MFINKRIYSAIRGDKILKLGIMQPYFIPYIGYWQLMNAVDEYVIYDDVNYIKGGWINRNRILVNGDWKYFNLPMIGASSNKLINQIEVNKNTKIVEKNLRIIEGAYKKAPFYNEVFPIIKQILLCGKIDLASYLAESLKIIGNYIGINTKLILSSTLEKECNLKGQEKVISICKLLGATEYYNAIGGRELYSYEKFAEKKIQLKFIQTEDIVYQQFNNEFQPNLSILDVMMFNDKSKINQFLDAYKIIQEK